MEIGTGVVGDFGFPDGGRQATGFHVEEVLGRGDFVASGVEVDLIGGEAEVANGEFVFGEGFMEKGFEPAVVLLSVGEAASDDGDVVAFLELDLSVGREAEEGCGE
jgi:hypothetical protein